MRTYSGILVSLMLLMALTERAQAQRHYFIPYSVNEGLAQSQVRDIQQSQDGFIWIATVGGISRFDGINFQTFNKSNGLDNNLTNALHPLSDGDLMASCSGGMVRFSRGTIENIPFEDSYSSVLVNDFLNTEEGLILGTNGKGLLFFSDSTVQPYIDLGSNERNYIRCLGQGGDQVLAGTKDGLILIENKEVTILNDSISVNGIESYGSTHWIATNGDGLFRFQQGELVQFSKEDGLLNMYVRDICVDKLGNPWLISKNTIQRYLISENRFEEIKSLEPERTSNMKVIFCDEDQTIWIGTDGYGILKYTGAQFEIYSTEDGLSSNIVMDIDQRENGTYVFATYGYGVILMDGENIDTIGNAQGLTNLTVWSLLTHENEVWLGSSSGIQILDKDGWVRPFEANDQLPFPRISNLFEDSHGRIWIATRDGVSYWDGESLQLPESIETLKPQDCKGFAETDDAIWIVTSSGLLEYRIDGSSVMHNKSSGLPEELLSCIALDEQGTIWMGTEEGLMYFVPETQNSGIIKISDKVSSNILTFLENQKDDLLWIGTDNGLFHLDLKKYYAENISSIRGFNKHDGVISNECNQNACFSDEEGNVWFGTNGGLLKYTSNESQEDNQQVIGVHLSDLQINFESKADILKLVSTDSVTPEFSYENNRVTFRYSAIHFSNPDKVSYSYRLVGLDDEWSPPTKEEYVTFSNLAPGDYHFEVRSRVEQGEWSVNKIDFSFTIAAPFWMRWWFILVCVGVFGAITYWFVYQYRQQEKRKRALRESLNQAKVLGLEQQTLNAHMNRHFIFNALNSIQYYINSQERDQANQYLTKFASLVRKNLDSAQSESISLTDELERLKLYTNLEQMRFQDKFSFDIKVDDDIDTDAVFVPSMILQPFVENSIMHGILPTSRHGNILVSIHKNEHGIEFTIDDDGIGIETSLSTKNGTSKHVSNGMRITKQRLELLAERANGPYGVKGPFERKDEKDNTVGTRVVIVLPLNYQRYAQKAARNT